MNEVLRQKCDLLAENRNRIRKAAILEGDHMAIAAAFVFTGAGVLADVERLKQCRAILKQRKGIFSEFRGLTEMVVVSKMALSPDPAGYLAQLNAVYDLFRQGHVFSSSYMVLAAVSIIDRAAPGQAEAAVAFTKEIHKGLNEAHRFLTDEQDLPMAALMALSGKSKELLLTEAETAYQTLKPKFSLHKNAVQGLGLVMASLDGVITAKCEKVIEIYDKMRARKIRYGKEYELASLGCLSTMNIPTEELIDEIVETAEYLKGHKGFGGLSIDKRERLMYAALMTSGTYGSEAVSRNVPAVSGTLSALIATQIAMMIIMMQTTMIVSSSSSH